MKLGVQGELVKKEIEIQARLISTAPTKAEAKLLKIMMPIRLKKILFASFIAYPPIHRLKAYPQPAGASTAVDQLTACS